MKKLLSSDRIKAEALRLGFSACGLAPAEAVEETVAYRFPSMAGGRLPGRDGVYAEL